MSTFDIIILIGAFCGLLMVAGGIVLLYKGAITLDKAPINDAVSLEFKKMIKITTQYPGLGFFIIGLAFIMCAALFAKPSDVNPLEIKGSINIPDPSAVKIYVTAGPWEMGSSTEGKVEGLIYPHLHILEIEITAPGYSRPVKRHLTKGEIKFGSLSLGEITEKDFGIKVTEKPTAGLIVTPNAPLPGLSHQGKF